MKRDNAVYCGKCALARDWEEVIHVVQADRLTMDTKPAGKSPASKPGSVSVDSDPVEVKAEAESAEASAPSQAPPADPFA